MSGLGLPPLFTPVVIGAAEDVRTLARGLAQEGADAGTFVFADREDRLECATILRPEQTVADSLPAVLVASLALDDAIGALAPPGLESDLQWPGTVRVNGARAGAVALLLPPGCAAADVPAWLAVAAWVRIVPVAGFEAGEDPTETCLRDEGCADATARGLAAAFARGLVHWVDRWLDDGLAEISRHWLHRASRHGKETALTFGDDLVVGTVEGLDDSGALIVESGSGRRVIALRQVLADGCTDR